MISILKILSAPGTRNGVTRTAATQIVEQEIVQVSENGVELQLRGISLARVNNVVDDEKPHS